MTTIAKLERKLYRLTSDDFMQPIIYSGTFWKIETDHGTEYLDFDTVNDAPIAVEFLDYIEGREVYSFECVNGYAGYFSANGYMDRTSLAVYPSMTAALEALIDEVQS